MNDILIVDFGSQYTKLIAKKIRNFGYFCRVVQVDEALEYDESKFSSLVISGGPQSSTFQEVKWKKLLHKSKPILGICYGAQFIAENYGGKVKSNHLSEFGDTKVFLNDNYFPEKKEIRTWMSHNDSIVQLPDSFKILGRSKSGAISYFVHNLLPVWGVQFHPEVDHTELGDDILTRFISEEVKIEKNWDSDEIESKAVEYLTTFKDKKVFCALSGGVDSLVCAVLAKKVLGDSLSCYFVDTGLSRTIDYENIDLIINDLGIDVTTIDARDHFYSRLNGISDPEEKRKIIGKAFIDVFDREIKNSKINFSHLLQGTLYPDVIESLSPHGKDGKSVTIKSHHNVGGLPVKLKLKIIEPLRELFKNEVRDLGRRLKINRKFLNRHPFPGPGLGIRIIGEFQSSEIPILQKADQILQKELLENNCYDEIAQAAVMLLPAYSVGIKGDRRVYGKVIAIRLVSTKDFMTADFSRLPYEIIGNISNKITNEIEEVSRVVYDISSKPPATIEWE